MSIWWRRLKRWLGGAATTPSPPPPAVPDDGDARRAARKQGERQFLDAADQNLEVHQLAEKLRAQREANDWGTALERSIAGLRGHP